MNPSAGALSFWRCWEYGRRLAFDLLRYGRRRMSANAGCFSWLSGCSVADQQYFCWSHHDDHGLMGTCTLDPGCIGAGIGQFGAPYL